MNTPAILRWLLPAFVLMLGMTAPAAILQAQRASHSETRIMGRVKDAHEGLMRPAPGFAGVSLAHPAIQALASKYAGATMRTAVPPNTSLGPRKRAANRIVFIDFPKPQPIEQAVADYMATGLFDYVEPDFMGGTDQTVPTDQYINSGGGGNSNELWGLKNDGSTTPRSGNPISSGADTEATFAWDITTGSASIVVGVIDTGLNPNHLDLNANVWSNAAEASGLTGVDDDDNGFVDDTWGWVFVGGTSCTVPDDNDPSDDQGHGTHVSSIISAEANNNGESGGFKGGIVGMTWNCKIMPVKALDCNNSGFYSNWVSAIMYAVNNGAHVINMSASGASYSATLQDAVDYAYENGVAFICSMGNAGTETIRYPAAYGHSIAVGATNGDDTRSTSFGGGSSGSNFHRHNDVVAPGNWIYGASHTNNSGYVYKSGTSQATPHVTGVAALLLSLNSNLAPAEIRRILHLSSEDQVGNSGEDVAGWDKYHGYGRLNAFQAVSNHAAYDRISTFPHTESFENGPGSWSAGGTEAYSWSWGTPAGSNISAAPDGSKAWVTNLTGNHDIDEDIYIESPVFDFSALANPSISFSLYVDTESGVDGARLEYSLNNDSIWTPIGSAGSGVNWYGGSVSGLSADGWSGSTGGWVTASHDLGILAGEASVMLRFRFVSNDFSEGEGIGIDQIEVDEGVPAATVFSGGTWSNGPPGPGEDAIINEPYDTDLYGNLSSGNLTLNAALTIGAGDSVVIGGTLANAGNIVADPTSVVVMNGSAPQTLEGVFGVLAIDNPSGVALSGATGVQRLLYLASGTLTTGGHLTMQSSANAQAMAAFAGGEVSGIVTLQRYLPDNSGETWWQGSGSVASDYYRYFSAPFSDETVDGFSAPGFALDVAEAASFNTNWNQTFASFPNYFLYDEGRISSNDVNDDNGNLIKGWRVPGSTDALTQGRGFLAHTPDEVTASMAGTVAPGDVTVTGIADGGFTQSGWHLLGNPFLSPIDGAAFLADNTAMLDESLYLLMAVGEYDDTWQSYVNGVSSPAGWDARVAVGQGFFVKRKSGASGSSVLFDRSNIASASFADPSFYRTQSGESRAVLRLRLVAPNGQSDETAAYRQQGARFSDFDPAYDAHKFGSNPGHWPTAFWLSESGQRLSINGVPEQAAGALAWSAWLPMPGAYQLQVAEALDEGEEAYLEDLETGETVRLQAGTVYRFTAGAPGLLQGRFRVHIGQLPDVQPEPTAVAYTSGGLLHVRLQGVREASVRLYDLQGRVAGQWKDVRQSGAWAIPGLKSGMYVAEIESEAGIQRHRVYWEGQ